MGPNHAHRMPFLRSLKHTAPNADPNLPWPIHGLAYVSMFMGPLAAGPLVGMLARDWRAFAIGLLLGIAITFLHAWLSDRFLDPSIARFQRFLLKRLPCGLVNIVAFAWAIALSAVSVLSPVAILGTDILGRLR